jgi:predicted nucleic acid-binding protein
MILSEKQQNILDVWNNEDCNILINAVAGGSKTTTLLLLLEHCQEKTLFLAFNKSIKEEIQNKIESKNLTQGKAMTIHSLGLSAIRNSYKNIKIDNGKNFSLIKKLQFQNKRIFKKLVWKDKLKMSYDLMDMNDISRLFLIDDVESIRDCFITMDKSLVITPDLKVLWQRFLELRNASYESNLVLIDFNDMIYLPVVKSLQIPIYPHYLMVD